MEHLEQSVTVKYKKIEGTLPRELNCAGSLGLAFANTAAPTRDDRRRDCRILPPTLSYAGLVTWSQRMGVLTSAGGEELPRAAATRPQQAEAVAARAVELRHALLRLFTTLALGQEPAASDLAILNREIAVRQVTVEADGFGWSREDEAEALDRMLWPIAQSAADLLISGRYRRVRQCGTKGCFRLFLYANSRRIWCDASTCGNRAKGRRYQEMWRRARQYNEEKRRRESARRLAEYRKMKAEKGEVAEFDQEDPEFGVWSDAWGEQPKE